MTLWQYSIREQNWRQSLSALPSKLLGSSFHARQTQGTTILDCWWWIKILQMITLVKVGSMLVFPWETQIMNRENQTNAINATMPLFWQAIWRHIWKRTVEKSQTNATNVTLLCIMQALWGIIWKYTVRKSRTNATNVTLPPLRQAIWGHIWKCTVGRSQIIAINATLHPCMQAIWGSIR